MKKKRENPLLVESGAKVKGCPNVGEEVIFSLGMHSIRTARGECERGNNEKSRAAFQIIVVNYRGPIRYLHLSIEHRNVL